MNYCTHASCQHETVVELLALSELTRRPDVHRVAVQVAKDDTAQVKCRQTHRMQFSGAIEYDSWQKVFA